MDQNGETKQYQDSLNYQDDHIRKFNIMHAQFMDIYNQVKKFCYMDFQYNQNLLNDAISKLQLKKLKDKKFQLCFVRSLQYLKWLINKAFNCVHLNRKYKKYQFREPKNTPLKKQLQQSRIRVSKLKAGIPLNYILKKNESQQKKQKLNLQQLSWQAILFSIGLKQDKIQEMKLEMKKEIKRLIQINESEFYRLRKRFLSEEEQRRFRNNITQYIKYKYLVEEMSRHFSVDQNSEQVNFFQKYNNFRLYFQARQKFVSYFLGQKLYQKNESQQKSNPPFSSKKIIDKNGQEKTNKFEELQKKIDFNRKRLEDLLSVTEKYLHLNYFQSPKSRAKQPQQQLVKYAWEIGSTKISKNESTTSKKFIQEKQPEQTKLNTSDIRRFFIIQKPRLKKQFKITQNSFCKPIKRFDTYSFLISKSIQLKKQKLENNLLRFKLVYSRYSILIAIYII